MNFFKNLWERWSDFTTRYPRRVLGGVLFLTLLLAPGLLRLDLGTVLYDFRRPSSRELVETIENNFREGNYLTLIFVSTSEKSLFTPELLKEQFKIIRAIHEKFQVKSDSLVEAMDAGLKRVKKKELLEVEDYTLIAEGLMGLSGGKTVRDLEQVSRHMLSHPEAIGYYNQLRVAAHLLPLPTGSLLPGQGGDKPTFEIPYVKAAKALIQLDPTSSEVERKKQEIKIRELAQKMAPPSLQVNLIANSLITSEIDEHTLANAFWMTLIVVAANSFLFWAFFRRRKEVFIPLTLMGTALLWTFSLAGWFGIRISFVHLLVIPILLGTADDDAFVFGMHLAEERSFTRDLKAALRVTSAKTGTAIFLTTFTTFIAFMCGALPSSSIAIRSFNILISFAMMAVFFLSILLQGPLRLMMAGRSLKKKEEKLEGERLQFLDWMNRLTQGMGRLSFKGISRHSRMVFIGFLALFLLGIGFTFRVPSDFDRKIFLRPYLQTYEANRQDEKYFGRSDPGYILIEGEVENPLLFQKMKELKDRMAKIKGIETVLGQANTDFVDDLFEKKGLAFNSPTSIRAALGQVTQSDATANFAMDQTYREAAEHLVHKTGDRYDGLVLKFFVEGGRGKEVRAVVQRLEKEIDDLGLRAIPGLRFRIGGGNISYHLEEGYFFGNFIWSFFISLVFNFLTLLLFWRSFSFSALAMIPVFGSLALTLGVMGLFQIPLNILNLVIGSVIVGVGIDYPIHLIERFEEERKGGTASPTEAMERALANLGPGLWGGTLTTVIGFGACTVLAMPLAVSFGLLMALGIFLAYLATIFALPVLLVRMKGRISH